MPRSPRALTLMLVVTMILSAMGCSASDKHVFVSTVHQPTTLTLLDVYQNQAVWEMDVPVNHKLVLDFDNDPSGQKADASGSPSWVDWKLYRIDDQSVDAGKKHHSVLVDSERVDLTGTKVRMQVNYRPSPEMPGSLEAAPVPVRETAESVAAEAVAESKAQGMAAPAEEAAPVADEPAEEMAEAPEAPKTPEAPAAPDAPEAPEAAPAPEATK